MWMNVDHVLIPLVLGTGIGEITMKIFLPSPHNTRDGRRIVRSVFHFAHRRDGVTTSRRICVRRPVGYMFNAPLGACDRRMGFMAQTLGPRTGPAGASTVSGKSAA